MSETNMACPAWSERISAYLDAELDDKSASELLAHLAGCPACTRDALKLAQMKRAVRSAGQRYSPSSAFRTKVLATSAPRPKTRWTWVPALAAAVVVLAAGLWFAQSYLARGSSEYGDLHIAMLASATPYDVTSSDRHTVKPWFQGKLPFAFNLPEVQGSAFTLEGGRLVYVAGHPTAELIYAYQRHKISVFVAKEDGLPRPAAPTGFSTAEWKQGGLEYVAITDASADTVRQLQSLFESAAKQ